MIHTFRNIDGIEIETYDNPKDSEHEFFIKGKNKDVQRALESIKQYSRPLDDVLVSDDSDIEIVEIDDEEVEHSPNIDAKFLNLWDFLGIREARAENE